jgi:protoheme IX farnesyltransferase
MTPLAVAVTAASTSTRSADFLALTKPRLNLLVIATAAAGYYLGATEDRFEYLGLLNTLVGTALVAGGSAAFNQLFERRVDALMERTRDRPLASARLGTSEAFWFASVLSVAGLVWLGLGTNWLAAGVALTTLVTYVLLYTPLKLKTSFATVIGAIPGALPPMIGWAAATHTISREAWLLVAIVFFWQMPHFLAIAWLFRDDYSRAGFPLLPVVEPDGRSTANQVVTYASALIPVSLAPSIVGISGPAYFVVALILGLTFLCFSVRFAMTRTRHDAKALFLSSIAYLPLIWIAMILDSLGRN